MTAEHSPENTVHPFSRGPAHRGQIRFDPSEGFREELSGLFLPEKREIGRRATKLYLSSQYVLIAYKAPQGQYIGNQGKKADRLRRAVERGGKLAQHRLGREVEVGTASRSDREFLALKFAVHLNPLILHNIEHDELLQQEPIVREGDPTLGAIVVFEGDSIYKGEQREVAIQKLREFVVGHTPLDPAIEPHRQLSPHTQAHVTNARFTFAPPHLST